MNILQYCSQVCSNLTTKSFEKIENVLKNMKKLRKRINFH